MHDRTRKGQKSFITSLRYICPFQGKGGETRHA